MKKLLKLSLAAMAIAALAACGGGDSSEAADTFVGNWKSKCYGYTSVSGATYYATRIMALTKTSAAELAANYSNTLAHSDSGCTNPLGTIQSSSPAKINLGADTTFLGAAAKAIVVTLTTGEARQGFITANASNLNIVITDATGARPLGWGAASPYTKQ
jgi:hypothetical protein